MFGTAVLVLVGPGTVVATLTLAGKTVPAVTEADFLAIAFAFGFIVMALVYAIGKVSGCHINPAVTFALAATKRFPWKEIPVYWGAQFVGAVIGAFAVWGVFGSNAIELGMGQTHIAADASSSVYLQAALAEALGTGLLIFAILGIVDSKSPVQLAGIVIGGALVANILVFGPITGASLNPARAFGPGDRRRHNFLDTICTGLPGLRLRRRGGCGTPLRPPGHPAPGRAANHRSCQPRRQRLTLALIIVVNEA
jgi:glycerol uptake facilitator protein